MSDPGLERSIHQTVDPRPPIDSYRRPINQTGVSEIISASILEAGFSGRIGSIGIVDSRNLDRT
jgi:hypothetical protein